LQPPTLRSRTTPNSFAGLLRAAWQEYERDHARYFASAMVYHALVSLLPLLLLVLAALGLFLRFSTLAAGVEEQVLQAVESSVGGYLRTTIERLFAQLQHESVVATLVSLGGLMLTASALFRHLRLSFRAIWRQAPPLVAGPIRVVVRATVLEYAVAYLMVLAGGLLLVATLVLLSVTHWLGDLLIRVPLLSRTPAWMLALPGSVIVVGITFLLLFKFLPPVRLRWRHVWLPAALCTAAWIAGAELMVFVGAVFGQSPTASGAFGGLLAAILWINAVSQLLFLGAEMCKVIAWRDEAWNWPLKNAD